MGWAFGTWKAALTNGHEAILSIAWDLDSTVVSMNVKVSGMEAKSFTVLEPGSEAPQYYGFDSKGWVSKGSWTRDGDEFVLTTTTEVPGRGARKAAFVFGGTKESGLRVRQYALDADGKREPNPRSSFSFKKQS